MNLEAKQATRLEDVFIPQARRRQPGWLREQVEAADAPECATRLITGVPMRVQHTKSPAQTVDDDVQNVPIQ